MHGSRGVDVRVVLPTAGDSGFMNAANLVAANVFVRNGIRVYAYRGMTHVKAAIYDGWACLGSANFDKLSLQINLETDIATSDPAFVGRLKRRVVRARLRRDRRRSPRRGRSDGPPTCRVSSRASFRRRDWSRAREGCENAHMHVDPFLIEPQRSHDRPRVRELLQQSGLPVDDIDTSPVDFLVMREAGQVVGRGRTARAPTASALLRSLAVLPSLHGQGRGGALVAAAERLAEQHGIDDLYLLTDTRAAASSPCTTTCACSARRCRSRSRARRSSGRCARPPRCACTSGCVGRASEESGYRPTMRAGSVFRRAGVAASPPRGVTGMRSSRRRSVSRGQGSHSHA